MAISLSVEDIDKILGITPGQDDDKIKQAGAESATTSTPTAAQLATPTKMPEGVVPKINPEPSMAAPQIGDTSAVAANALMPKIGEEAQPQQPTKAESIAAGKAHYAGGMPQITAMPGTELHGQQDQEKLEYQNAHPWGSPVSAQPGLLGKIGHVASKIGNIAGDIFAPGTMALIPGTDLNKQVQSNENQKEIAQGSENEEKNAQSLNLRSEAIKNLRAGAGGTPDEQTFADLQTQTNPATGKLYTKEEALTIEYRVI
jgi:hypothetical protein